MTFKKAEEEPEEEKVSIDDSINYKKNTGIIKKKFPYDI